MTESRWYDERFIKCKNCKKELIVFPLLGEKFFRCEYCGTKIRNKEYFKFMKRRVNNENKKKLYKWL